MITGIKSHHIRGSTDHPESSMLELADRLVLFENDLTGQLRTFYVRYVCQDHALVTPPSSPYTGRRQELRWEEWHVVKVIV